MDVLVIGAGAFGAWTAWFLNEAGHRVTLVDAYGPANARASSADHSRVIRCGYGADAIYSQWAAAALDDWRRLSREAGHELVVTSGALFMGAADDGYIQATHRTLSQLGIANEQLHGDAIHRRFPQIDPAGIERALFEPNAGVIRARAALQALVDLMRPRASITYHVGCVVTPDEQQTAPQWRLMSGESLSADVVVCACGPWLPRLLPSAVGARIRPTRQEVLHYGVPAGDHAYSLAALPVWIDFQAGVYGIPDFDGRGFKIGIDRHGAAIDPDTHDRVIDTALVERTRAWIGTRFPGLKDTPFVDGHVCQYENTSSGDFVIDRHPAWPNVWIAGGGSGHGFKHGPAVGRHVAALVSGAAAVDPRFALTDKTTYAARAVY
jgi:monomeric sarcosine oxidase